jgi:hypothetical protein
MKRSARYGVEQEGGRGGVGGVEGEGWRRAEEGEADLCAELFRSRVERLLVVVETGEVAHPGDLRGRKVVGVGG